MRVNTKISVRILSGILSVMLLLSCISSLPVSAATGQARGPVTSWGSGNPDWNTYSAYYEFVMAIRASSITDSTPADAMAKTEVRYGNGSSDQLFEYPLFIQMSVNHSHCAYNPSNVSYTDSDDNGERSVLYQNLKKEYDSLSGHASWRKSHSSEFLGFEDVSYNGMEGIKNFKPDNTRALNSVYLEDILKVVMDKYKDGSLSYYDMKNYWYFYTRFAAAANNDLGFDNPISSNRIGTANKLNKLIITDGGAVQKDAGRMKMIQSGYMVALYCAYGKTPYKVISDKSDFAKSDENYNNTLWSPETSYNRYKSFVVDKLVTNLITSDNNGHIRRDTLVSMTDYAHMVKIAGGMGDRDYMKEYASLTFIRYSNYNCMNDCGVSSIWHSALHTIVRHFFPKRSNGLECTVGGDSVYAGWGYYEVTDGSNEPTLPKPIRPSFPSVEQVGTEITYNAFLAGSNNSKWTEEIDANYNPDNIDAFANNGHVMSDTVYISKPKTRKDVARNGILARSSYIPVTVDSSITLSAPVENTEYKLKDLQYRITDANGMQELASNNPTTLNPKLRVKGSDLISAFNNENAGYTMRKKIAYTDKGLQRGMYKNANNSKGYYYVYAYDSNGNLVKWQTNSGSDYTTGGYKKSDGYTNCTADKKPNLPDYFKDKVYNANDLDENSKNYWYIEFPNGYMPAVYENNTWYLCPVIRITNLLVQFRADYTADFRDDPNSTGDNYDNTYTSVNFPQYMLTKNNNINDFTKKTLYTMLDNYMTGQWGTLMHKGYYFQNNTNFDSIRFDSNGSFNYGYASLRCSDNKGVSFQKSVYQSMPQMPSPSNGGSWSSLWSQTYYNNSISHLISNSRSKVQYIFEVLTTAPSFINATKSTFKHSNLSVNLRHFNAAGKSSVEVNSSLAKSGDLYYTDSAKDANRKYTGKSSLVAINRNGTMPTNYTERDIFTDNIPTYPAEGNLRSEDKLSTSIPGISYNATRNGIASNSLPKGYREGYFTKVLSTYEKYIFAKKGTIASAKTPYIASWKYSSDSLNGSGSSQGLLGKYAMQSSNTGKALGVAQGVYAGFYRFGASTITLTSAGKSKRFLRRILNSGAAKPAGLQYVKCQSNIDSSVLKGWLVNDSNFTLAEPFTQSTYDIPTKYNVYTYNTVDKPVQKINTVFNYTAANSNVIKATYQYSDSTYGNNIYPTSNSSGNNTAGIFKYKNSSGTYEDKVSIGLYPEVVMWAENDISGSTSPSTSNVTYSHVVTVGARERYIPAMTYTIANFNNGTVTARVTGTAVAFDTRAKALATRLGSASANTQVLYSGSALKIAYKANGAGTVKSYVLDFNGSIDTATKEQWGNKNYSANNAATAATKNIANQFTASIDKQLGIYNGTSFKTVDMGSSNSTALSVSAPTYTGNYYNLTIRNGQVTKVAVRSWPSGASTYTDLGTFNITYVDHESREYEQKAIKKITMVTDSANKPTVTFGSTTTVANCTAALESRIKKIREILNGMQLSGSNSVLNACFNNGASSKGEGEKLDMYGSFSTWLSNYNSEYNDRYRNKSGSTEGSPSYFEDTTVLQIKEYTANITTGGSSTATEQLPLTLGPETPSDKNKYFSNGYKGFVMASLEIKGKSTAPTSIRDKVVAKASTKHTDKNNSSTKYDLTSGTQAQKNSWASNAIPDFIIADVTINEATTY